MTLPSKTKVFRLQPERGARSDAAAVGSASSDDSATEEIGMLLSAREAADRRVPPERNDGKTYS